MNLEERARRLLHRVCHWATGEAVVHPEERHEGYLRWTTICLGCYQELAWVELSNRRAERIAQLEDALRRILADAHNGREGVQVKRMKAIAREALEAK